MEDKIIGNLSASIEYNSKLKRFRIRIIAEEDLDKMILDQIDQYPSFVVVDDTRNYPASDDTEGDTKSYIILEGRERTGKRNIISVE